MNIVGLVVYSDDNIYGSVVYYLTDRKDEVETALGTLTDLGSYTSIEVGDIHSMSITTNEGYFVSNLTLTPLQLFIPKAIVVGVLYAN